MEHPVIDIDVLSFKCIIMWVFCFVSVFVCLFFLFLPCIVGLSYFPTRGTKLQEAINAMLLRLFSVKQLCDWRLLQTKNKQKTHISKRKRTKHCFFKGT